MKKNQQDTEYMISIVKQLKLLREEMGVSQELFYMDTGIHIGRIETGKCNLTLLTLKKICDYCAITPKDFFDRVYSDGREISKKNEPISEGLCKEIINNPIMIKREGGRY